MLLDIEFKVPRFRFASDGISDKVHGSGFEKDED
jgi:hypothetical protein